MTNVSGRRTPPSPIELVLHTLGALLSAVLLLLIFPQFNIHLLAPLALAPLLIVVARTENAWQRFLYGWAAGIFYWFFLCTWIQFVLEQHGGMGRWGSWGSFLLFSMLKALHLAVFGLLAGPLMKKRYALLAVPALWTGLERTHGTFGFAWLALGNAGISMSLPLRLAPIVGVYGLSFVFCVLATALGCVVLRYPRTRLLPLAVLPLLWLLPEIPQKTPANETALVVQPNIDPDTQWSGAEREAAEDRLSLLSRALPSPLVIWPELPAPLYFYDDPQFRSAAINIARHGSYFLFGTVAYTREHQPLNSAVLLKPDGSEVGRYDKIDLVPFGEFVPGVFSFVSRITQEAGDFAPGHDIKVLNAAGHRLGTFICYESAFPDLVRQFSRQGADVLVNLSNDAYFGPSAAREQHLSLVRMRAVESRRFIIRSTNNGITAVIDPAGRITKQLPSYRELASSVRYGTVRGTTFYARHGDWFAWACLVLALLLCFGFDRSLFSRKPSRF
jgi:apolipoprotein N-acyltransferase